MADEMFDSATRAKGDMAGVFEYDGSTGYFYLYEIGKDDPRIVDSIHVVSGIPDFTEADVKVHWDATENRVAVFLRGTQWAVFNTATGKKSGGDYARGSAPTVAEEDAFDVARSN